MAKFLREAVEEELSLQKRIDGLHEDPIGGIDGRLHVIAEFRIVVVCHEYIITQFAFAVFPPL